MLNGSAPIRDLEPTLLRAFVTIVDAGTFSRAARRLNRTQSALSMQVKRLEELVDAVLFDRSSRPPALTPAGEKLAVHARAMLALNDSALEEIRADKISGQVRLGLMEDYAATHLAPLLARFRSRHPDVLVEVETGLTGAYVEQLGHRFDLVLTMTAADSSEGELLYRGRPQWAAAPGFEPRDHAVLPLALFRPGCLFRKWATAALDRDGRHWHMGLISTSIGAVAAAVREGWCISVFKDLTLPEGLKVLGPAEGLPALPDYEMRLLSAPSANTGAAKALADALRAAFETQQ